MKRFMSNAKQLIKAMIQFKPIYFFYVSIFIISTTLVTWLLITLPRIALSMLETQNVNWNLLIIYFVLLFGASFLLALSKYKFSPITAFIRFHFLSRVFKQKLTIPYELYDNPERLNQMWDYYRPLTGLAGVQGFFMQGAIFLSQMGIVIVAAVMLLQLNVFLFLLVIGWSFIQMVLSYKIAIWFDVLQQKNIDTYRRFEYFEQVTGDFAYGKEIRTQSLQSYFSSFYTQLFNPIISIFKTHEQHVFLLKLAEGVYQFIRDYLMYAIFIYMYINGTIGLAVFSSYLVLLSQLNSAIKKMMDALSVLFENQDVTAKMLGFLSLQVDETKHDPIVLEDQWTLEFKDVCFKYPNTDYVVFDHLNFIIKSQTKIAIVGLNGAGKTTMMKLLMRLYEPTSGSILLNGININEYEVSSYMSLFAPVFQDIYLYAFTVKENLCFDLVFDKEKAISLLKQTNVYDKLNQTDDFFNQEMTRYINQDGIMLSGGESQKFVMARALYYQRPILVLDEPTSALDAIAEASFYQQLSDIAKDKTMFFISHRLASTTFCDTIILIEHKGIKEWGTHQQLMALKGRYYDLFNIQSKYYKEDSQDEQNS